MHGQVRGVGHQGAVRAKQGAGEVEALLDVDADAGALQHPPHLLSYAHEPARAGQAAGGEDWAEGGFMVSGGYVGIREGTIGCSWVSRSE